MKKLLVIFVFCLAVMPVNAQTESETKEWLNAKLPSLLADALFAPTFDLTDIMIVKKREVGTNVIYEKHEIYYSDITSVEYSEGEKGFYMITLTGKTRRYVNGERKPELKSTSFELKSTDKTNIEKFVKALKHFATLKGAELVKDDLF